MNQLTGDATTEGPGGDLLLGSRFLSCAVTQYDAVAADQSWVMLGAQVTLERQSSNCDSTTCGAVTEIVHLLDERVGNTRVSSNYGKLGSESRWQTSKRISTRAVDPEGAVIYGGR